MQGYDFEYCDSKLMVHQQGWRAIPPLLIPAQCDKDSIPGKAKCMAPYFLNQSVALDLGLSGPPRCKSFVDYVAVELIGHLMRLSVFIFLSLGNDPNVGNGGAEVGVQME